MKKLIGIFLAMLVFGMVSDKAKGQEDMISFNCDNLQLKFVRPGEYLGLNLSEWLIVDGDIWLLSFPLDPDDSDGTIAKKAAERALGIIKYYRLNQQIFFGRPQRLVSYYMSDGQSPTGPYPGEEAIPIDPNNVAVRTHLGHWLVVSGNQQLVDFQDEFVEARKCAATIKRLKFTYMCFMGSFHPYMTYFRCGGPQILKIPPIKKR
jgi:hypothetical protein